MDGFPRQMCKREIETRENEQIIPCSVASIFYINYTHESKKLKDEVEKPETLSSSSFWQNFSLADSSPSFPSLRNSSMQQMLLKQKECPAKSTEYF